MTRILRLKDMDELQRLRKGMAPAEKQSKYKNVRTEVNGVWFDSKKEADRYILLKGLHHDLVVHPKFDLWGAGIDPKHSEPTKVCTYEADFMYRGLNGHMIVEDCKGVRTAVYKLKKKLMLICYGIEIQEV